MFDHFVKMSISQNNQIDCFLGQSRNVDFGIDIFIFANLFKVQVPYLAKSIFGDDIKISWTRKYKRQRERI